MKGSVRHPEQICHPSVATTTIDLHHLPVLAHAVSHISRSNMDTNVPLPCFFFANRDTQDEVDSVLLEPTSSTRGTEVSNKENHQPSLDSRRHLKQSTPTKVDPRPISPFTVRTTAQRSSSKRATVLTSLLFERKYLEANRRVKEYPEEAFMWIQKSNAPRNSKPTELRAPSVEASTISGQVYNRLPLHIACADLAAAAESRVRFQLEQLILRLVLVFPEACSLMDHENKFPLHEAIWNNATPETISMLLMADPSSVYQKDQCGRNATEINCHRSGVFVEQVKELLSMGKAFWEQARCKSFGSGHGIELDATNETQHCLYSLCIDMGEQDAAYDSSLTLDLESESILSLTVNSVIEQGSLDAHVVSPENCSFVSELATLSLHGIHDQDEANTEQECAILHSICDDWNENPKLSDITSTFLNHERGEVLPDRDLGTRVHDSKLTLEKHFLLKRLLIQQLHSRMIQDSPPPDTPAAMKEVVTLRIQNAALKKKVERLRLKKNRQAEKIGYLKSIVSCTTSDGLLVDYSETESSSTFSLLESTATDFVPSDIDTDDLSSTMSSFHLRLAPGLKSAVNDYPERKEDCSVVITGLAVFRFRDLVTRLQSKVSAKKFDDSSSEINPIKTDQLADLCSIAAEIYADIVRERPVAATLILQWEPPRPSCPS